MNVERLASMPDTGFHEGEIAVQRQAHVEADAKRLEGMLAPGRISDGAAKFLTLQTSAALTARDRDGVLWISPLVSRPGFLSGGGDLLSIATAPRRGDPLEGLPPGQQVGVIAIDFAARRRMRINGLLDDSAESSLTVRVNQAYGNCPQYIHPRHVNEGTLTAPSALRRSESLTDADRELIARADTFFLGTTHPTRGSDASHRGGPVGFVRVDSPSRLWWPDYPGNNMFNSFGNLAVDDEAALLFVDFNTGETVQLSGRARVRWTARGVAGDDGGVGRRVEFDISAVAASD